MTELTRRTILAGTAAVVGSAGSTSTQAAAPPAGKQAPGFYRYKVGSHEVTVLTDGARSFALTESYVTNAPIAEVRKALVEAYLPPDKMIHHYAPIVINTGAKLIVVDTGSGPGAFKQTNGELGQLPQNLAAAGIKMTDIDTVRDLAFPRRSRERSVWMRATSSHSRTRKCWCRRRNGSSGWTTAK